MLKQGIRIKLPVEFSGIDMAVVERIEFIFKSERSKDAETKKVSVYISDGSGDAHLRPETSIIDVPWTESDTYIFPINSLVYMDTKMYVEGSNDNPITPIVSFEMCDTLFGEDDIHE